MGYSFHSTISNGRTAGVGGSVDSTVAVVDDAGVDVGTTAEVLVSSVGSDASGLESLHADAARETTKKMMEAGAFFMRSGQISAVTQPPDRSADDWQPATSKPGELYTFEGEMRSIGFFAGRLRTDDPRLRAYRRTMARQGWWFLGAAVAVPVVIVFLDWLF